MARDEAFPSDTDMAYTDLRDFITQLEATGELRHVHESVSPHLEMTALSDRVLRAGGPALLFTQPTGHAMPVLTNLFGTPARVARGMGADNVSALRDIGELLASLREPEAPGARRAVADTIRRGNDGVERLPGKHGQNRRFETLVVMVDDTPGQLGRLFGELGELGVNVEDLRLEHSPGAQFGLAEISVTPSALRGAFEGLEARGWRIASVND